MPEGRKDEIDDPSIKFVVHKKGRAANAEFFCALPQCIAMGIGEGV